MKTGARIEETLERVIARAMGAGAPPLLASALHYAVFPGGHRIRPQLCLAVAQACGDGDLPTSAAAAAAAIELLHCASLVHDDLPCFDDADTRRGKPSVHAHFGTPIAVLAGDALIVLAFETLARAAAPERLPLLISIVAAAVGAPSGIVAGQAWECEAAVPLVDYQRAKTGALFVGSTMAGAAAAGLDPEPWREAWRGARGSLPGRRRSARRALRRGGAWKADRSGRRALSPERGRPTRDRRRQGPARAVGSAAADSIPDCPGRDDLGKVIEAQTAQLFPKQLQRVAA